MKNVSPGYLTAGIFFTIGTVLNIMEPNLGFCFINSAQCFGFNLGRLIFPFLAFVFIYTAFKAKNNLTK